MNKMKKVSPSSSSLDVPPSIWNCDDDDDDDEEEIWSVQSSSHVHLTMIEQCLFFFVFSRHHHHQQLIEHIFFFILFYLDKCRRCTIQLINAWIVPSDLLVFSICVERENDGWMRIDRDVFDSLLSNWIIFTFPPVVNHNRRAIGWGLASHSFL